MNRENIAIIGAGTMGSGLAVLFASHGHQVWLHDVTDGALGLAVRRIRSYLDLLSEMKISSSGEGEEVMKRITTSMEMQECCAPADFLIEAAPEEIELKRRLFPELAALTPSHCVLASNTSTLNVPGEVEGDFMDRVLIAHFFNPPQIIPLVEVVRGEATSDEAAGKTVDLMRRVDRIPLVMDRYIPGFVINRFQLAINSMSYFILSDGIIGPQDIDAAVESSIGLRLAAVGPFATMDLGGLDVVYESARTMGVEPPEPLRELVEKGKLGVKAGKGFYDYAGRTLEEVERERNRKLLLLLDAWRKGR